MTKQTPHHDPGCMDRAVDPVKALPAPRWVIGPNWVALHMVKWF